MAAYLKRSLGVEAELIRGGMGEFSIWVDGVRVVEKTGQVFPTPEECEAAVARAATGTGPVQ